MNKWLKKGYSKTLSAFLACGVLLVFVNLLSNTMRTSGNGHHELVQEVPHACIEEIYSCCEATRPHILVTPDALCGLRLNELFRLVLEHACATNTLQELPEGLMACFERLENGAQTVHAEDLAQALPVLIAKLTSIVTAASEKAPRPDAPGNIDGAPVGTLLGCDVSDVLSILNRLTHSVIQCCDTLQRDFFFTWTILADIKATVSACCTDTEGTFTLLTEILNSVTGCCNGTFTVLAEIFATVTSTPCVVTPISQASIDAAGGTFVIVQAGNYALTEDISSDASTIITIDASGVTLDLCGRTIAGFSNGSTANIGIEIDPFASAIVIKNGYLISLANAGILVSEGAQGLVISDIQTTLCTQAGIVLAGSSANPIRECYITNCRASLCANSVAGQGGLVLQNCDTVVVQGGIFNRNGAPDFTPVVAGVFIISSTNCSVSGASMNENTGLQAYGLAILGGANNTVTSCIANSNAGISTLGTSTCLGFVAISGLENGFTNCTALMNTGSVAYGLGLVGRESLSSIVGCRAESNVGSLAFTELNNINGAGVIVDGAGGAAFNEVQNNLVVRNNQSGIFDSSISFTVSAGTAFVVAGSSTTLVSGNSAVDNGLAGPPFATTTPFSNYTVAYPVAQPVEFISFRYSVGGSPVVSPAGNTMIANIDTRFS